MGAFIIFIWYIGALYTYGRIPEKSLKKNGLFLCVFLCATMWPLVLGSIDEYHKGE